MLQRIYLCVLGIWHCKTVYIYILCSALFLIVNVIDDLLVVTCENCARSLQYLARRFALCFFFIFYICWAILSCAVYVICTLFQLYYMSVGWSTVNRIVEIYWVLRKYPFQWPFCMIVIKLYLLTSLIAAHNNYIAAYICYFGGCTNRTKNTLQAYLSDYLLVSSIK